MKGITASRVNPYMLKSRRHHPKRCTLQVAASIMETQLSTQQTRRRYTIKHGGNMELRLPGTRSSRKFRAIETTVTQDIQDALARKYPRSLLRLPHRCQRQRMMYGRRIVTRKVFRITSTHLRRQVHGIHHIRIQYHLESMKMSSWVLSVHISTHVSYRCFISSARGRRQSRKQCMIMYQAMAMICSAATINKTSITETKMYLVIANACMIGNAFLIANTYIAKSLLNVIASAKIDLMFSAN